MWDQECLYGRRKIFKLRGWKRRGLCESCHPVVVVAFLFVTDKTPQFQLSCFDQLTCHCVIARPRRWHSSLVAILQSCLSRFVSKCDFGLALTHPNPGRKCKWITSQWMLFFSSFVKNDQWAQRGYLEWMNKKTTFTDLHHESSWKTTNSKSVVLSDSSGVTFWKGIPAWALDNPNLSWFPKESHRVSSDSMQVQSCPLISNLQRWNSSPQECKKQPHKNSKCKIRRKWCRVLKGTGSHWQ